MGCGCGGGTRSVAKNKAAIRSIKSQTIPKKTLQRATQIGAIGVRKLNIVSRTIQSRKTCPKCGWILSSSVRRYDPITKTAKQEFICTNRKRCNYKIDKL